MSENTTEVVVGAGVLVIAAAFVIYATQFTGFGNSGGSYELHASFRSADGISSGTDVRLAGVKIGSVTDVELDPKTFRARADFSVKDGIDIPDDSQIVVSSEGLLGGNYLEVMPGGSTFNYSAGDEIEDTQGSVSLISLLLKFVSGGGSESGS